MNSNSPSTSSTRPGSGAMFDGIAPRYDGINRLITVGLDQGWRRKTVRALVPDTGSVERILDLATGTADLACESARQYPLASIVGLDPSVGMLQVGREKVAASEFQGRIDLQEGKAEELPFEDNSFDGVTIAFGIRNVADRPAVLREMARVTRPGGRVAILEGNEPRKGLLAPFARFHLHHVVPRLGAWLSGAKEYRYLQSSIAAFPPPEEFSAMMTHAGLEVLAVRSLTFGVCYLYVARPVGEG